MSPKIAAVVPTMNRPVHLAECLRSLAASERPLARVIVVDASSPSEASRRAALAPEAPWPFHLDWMAAMKTGAAAQRNQGLAALEDEDTLLFLDDDIVLEPDCLG